MNLKAISNKAIKEYESLKKKRKLLIIGTGSITACVVSFFNINVEQDVLKFVESKPKGNLHLNKEIISLKDLNDFYEEYKSTLIIIASSEWKAIERALSKEVKENIDVFIPYDKYPILVSPLHKVAKKFQNFLAEQPFIKNVSVIKNKRILVMVGERAGSTTPFHAIGLAAILKMNGFNVEIIFNDLSRYGDYILGEFSVSYQNELIEEILVHLKENFDIKYFKLSSQNEKDLNCQEIHSYNEFNYYNKVWLTKNILFDKNDDKLLDISNSWLNNARKLKYFLENNSYDKVYCWTGIHGEWGILRFLCESIGYSRFYTEYARGGYCYSVNSPTVMQKDIAEIDESKIDINNINILELLGNRHELLLKSYEFDNYNLPLNINKPLVLIPLNIFWDSAAFNSEDVFLKFDEWLIITIEFLLKECKAQVIVRQHPHEKVHVTGGEVIDLLVSKFGDNSDFYFIDKYTDFNTYSILNHVDLVLPNTSTVGIEAAILGKHVIVKNDVYYSKLGFVQRAYSVEEYFELIKSALLKNDFVVSEEMKNKAKFYYALTMENSIEPFLGHFYRDFIKLINFDISEVNNHESVRWLIEMIESDQLLLLNKLLSASNRIS